MRRQITFNDEAVKSTALALKSAAEEHAMHVTADGRVSDADASALTGVAPATLKNGRSLGTGPTFFRVGVGNGSRVSYRLVDLAFWLERQREDAAL